MWGVGLLLQVVGVLLQGVEVMSQGVGLMMHGVGLMLHSVGLMSQVVVLMLQGVGSMLKGVCSLNNFSNKLIFILKLPKKRHFFSQKTGKKRAMLRSMFFQSVIGLLY